MITAVVSKKGGVGKTTTTVNLAAALAARGRRVLLVDLDPNASATLSLGLARHQCVPSAADLLLRGRSGADAARPVRDAGIDIIPSSIDLASVEGDLDRVADKELVLARALVTVAHRYDEVVIDCPSSFGLLTRNALAAAEGYLLPSPPHFLAIEGLEWLIEAIERLCHRTQRATRLIGILPTLADYRARATRMALDNLRRRFGNKVFAVEIRVNTSLAEAPAFGQTIFEYKPSATGAHAHDLLAEEYLMRTRPAVGSAVAQATTGSAVPLQV